MWYSYLQHCVYNSVGKRKEKEVSPVAVIIILTMTALRTNYSLNELPPKFPLTQMSTLAQEIYFISVHFNASMLTGDAHIATQL